ncbi:unnamed protein product [Meganyctiphanes norvegica]|uniref:Oplophorus-luciferin 2-monooxygenase non-catalytic subunit n=1 Tax=Meganyctiphanes norvegica TaxID=48144 RepID=A0AAV2SS65_MEGNR
MKSHIIILLYIGVACVCGQINSHKYPTASDVYNQSKVHVKQGGRHQPEYYGYEQPCPDAEDIAPCVCTYHTVDNVFFLDLDCSSINNEEQLKQIFKADFPFKNFKTFAIENNNHLKVLEAGVFNGISFEAIAMNNNKLEVIESQALDSCYETATSLELEVNYLTYFPFNELSLFPNLRRFDISSNSLSVIPADAFHGLTELEHLYIYDNKITSFPFDEVSQLSKLRDFDISNNLLSVIPADAFHGLTELENLYLHENNADIVGTFKDLPNLRDIWLVRNAMTTIPAQFINTGSSHLREIYLAYNNIVSVEPGAFDIVDGLDIIMSVNSLSILDEATWRPYLEAGRKLFADYNPLVCGCDIAWLFGEDQLLEQVGRGATCNDGEYLQDLDPSIFDNC